MRYLLSILALVSIVFAFSSCEKVIDVKLDQADKKIVIDAVLTDQAGGCQVKVSQTKNFNDDNSFAGIGGAVVTIADASGNTTTLNETSAGVYEAPALKGQNGATYRLKVVTGGQTYNATSLMPQKVTLDSVYTTKMKMFQDEEIFANVIFQDPAGVKNFYRFIQYVNGKRSKGIFVMDDDLSDGKLFNSTLYFFSDDNDIKLINPGDVITVEMQCIDAATYKYWFSMDQGATGTNRSASPANPVSNIDNGALGYFSAQVVQRKQVTAP
ncbi:DUF4249 domain-containing protein [Taibaiella chishuiensis]|uniref:Uncharacterized protein DUF4249 n=1 Tax=Taibaiella chishuiensis TaxID=1434707 RepID=A0A2P8DBG5_9BACT|nr:DUF4249 domain-containing protein [Taibaiella chishuiensis]PSK94563.1 uncharacterized protein DUF4249 [Taibaiella chishuiensis]